MNNAELTMYKESLQKYGVDVDEDDILFENQQDSNTPPSKTRKTESSSSTSNVTDDEQLMYDDWCSKFAAYRKYVRHNGYDNMEFGDVEDYSIKTVKFLYKYRHIDKEFAFVGLRLVIGMATSQLSESVYSYCQNQLFVNQNAETISARVKVNGAKALFLK